MARKAYHKASNTWRQVYDQVLDENPPDITWRRKNNGVWVAVKVSDPHAETNAQAQAERLRWSAAEAERESMVQQALNAAERFGRLRAENTPLMIAARTEI